MSELQSGEHPYQAQQILDQRAEIRDLRATLQKRREKEFKQEAIKKNCDRKWPYNLTIHDERQGIECVKSLQLLHKEACVPNEHINWLRDQIKAAFYA